MRKLTSSASPPGSKRSSVTVQIMPTSARRLQTLACIRSAKRPDAQTSANAGKTAKPHSSSAATSAPADATSARSIPESLPRPRRTSTRCRIGRGDGVAVRHGYGRGQRRPARPGRMALCADRAGNPRSGSRLGVEVLIPDFSGEPTLLGEVFAAQPEVLAHNLETVPRLIKRIRPAFTYERSLDVITQARSAGLITKSNLILGLAKNGRR